MDAQPPLCINLQSVGTFPTWSATKHAVSGMARFLMPRASNQNCCPLVSHKACSQWHGKVFNAQSQQSKLLPLTEIMNFKTSNTLLNSLLFVSVI